MCDDLLALTRGYAVINALTALATGGLMLRFGFAVFLVMPLALYVASAAVALVIARRLAAEATSAQVLGLAYLRSLSAVVNERTRSRPATGLR
ncbi:hypothetical protein [Dactylosporangium sp. NPDC049140]|uniref:hypothetical protein n=1 Tax=Dactylosporangium sp. NPDC049140 TaxID=3155647 RepID=UPI0033D3F524